MRNFQVASGFDPNKGDSMSGVVVRAAVRGFYEGVPDVFLGQDRLGAAWFQTCKGVTEQ